MTDFNFRREIRLDGILGVHIDYCGDIQFEYTNYGWNGPTSDGEIEFNIEELKLILAAAEAQRDKYRDYQESLK